MLFCEFEPQHILDVYLIYHHLQINNCLFIIVLADAYHSIEVLLDNSIDKIHPENVSHSYPMKLYFNKFICVFARFADLFISVTNTSTLYETRQA